MKTSLQGSYPKIPAGAGPSIRTAIQRFDRGSIGPAELEETFRAVTARVFSVAQAANVDRTTDGQIRWNDLFDAVVRDLDNVSSEGLLRFFDNNFYYRHPVIRGRLSYAGGTLAHWTRQAAAITSVELKVALPGPLTFWHLSEDQSYGQRERLMADLVEVLQLEANSLQGTGAVEIQWDEPALARETIDPGWAKEVLQGLMGGVQLPQSLALYWGKSSPWLQLAAELPLSTLYMDVVTEPLLLDRLGQERFPFAVGVGLLDARTVRLESVDTVARQLEPVLARQGGDRVWVHPNSGLELLPPDRAGDKVGLLRQIKSRIHGK